MNEKAEEKPLNDYDRIVLRIDKVLSPLWSTQVLLEKIKIGEHEQIVAPYVLQSIVKELDALKGWVEGLAETHRQSN